MALKPFAVKGYDVTSPRGTAMWCKVKEPDTKFEPKGEYTTGLVCDPDEPPVKAFIEKLEELRDIALAETRETLGAKGTAYKARPVFTEEVDRTSGEATGNILFKFKMSRVDDKTAAGNTDKIFVVDAKRQEIEFENIPLVGNGSLIRCVAYALPYSMASSKEVGVSLLWTKLQLIDVVEFNSGGGFDDEEGYTDTTAARVADLPTADADDF